MTTYNVSYWGFTVTVDADDEDGARTLGLAKIQAEIASLTEVDVEVEEADDEDD